MNRQIPFYLNQYSSILRNTFISIVLQQTKEQPCDQAQIIKSKLNMLSLQSPHNNHKPSQLLLQNISPSFRNKRIPSAHQSYSYSSNHNLKICKVESPSKLSQKLKRRKSQYINSSSSYLDKNDLQPQKKKSAKSITQIHTQVNQSSHAVLNVNGNIGPSTPSSALANNNNTLMYPQNIINEMNCLKNQYKQLKSAYQELIEEKINNSEKMAQIKHENRKLQAQLQIALQKLNASVTLNSHQINNSNNFSNNPNNPSSLPSNKPTLTTSASLESIQSPQLEFLRTQNQKQKQKIAFNELQLQRIKKECYKLLQAERFKSKKLQQSLKEKDDLLQIFMKQKPSQCNDYANFVNNFGDFGNKHLTDPTGNQSSKNIANSFKQPTDFGLNPLASPKLSSNGNINRVLQQNMALPQNNPAEESLFISQDKSYIDQTYNNQSQFISISLTSVMEESMCRLHQNIESKSLPKPQPKLSTKHQSKPKQTINETHINLTESTQTVMPHLIKENSKRQKLSSRQNQQNIVHEPNHNMKKMRKEVHQKLQLNLNHFDNNRKESFLNLKTPISTGDKKLMGKNKNSKSKKKDEDKENNLNYYHGKDVSDLNVGKMAKKKDKNHSLTHK